MFVCTLLFGGMAVAQANRMLPESTGMARHGAGAHGRGTFGAFGAFPIPVQTLSALRAARDAQADVSADGGRKFIDDESVDSLGGRNHIMSRLRLNTKSDRRSAKKELEALMSKKREEVVLRIADSWTHDDDGFDKELVIIQDNYAGSLRTLIKKYKGKLDVLTTLDLFLEVADQLRKLRVGGVAHDAPTTDEVLVAGDLDDVRSWHILLCSSMPNTDIRLHSNRGALMRLLNLQDPDDDSADIRSKREVETADIKSLHVLFEDLLDLLKDSEAKEVRAMARNLGMMDGDGDGDLDHVFGLAGALRRECMTRWSLEEVTAEEEQHKAWHLLGTLFKPKGAKADEAMADALVNSIHTIFEEAKEVANLEEFYSAKLMKAMSRSVPIKDSNRDDKKEDKGLEESNAVKKIEEDYSQKWMKAMSG